MHRSLSLACAAMGASLTGQQQVKLRLAASVCPIFELPALTGWRFRVAALRHPALPPGGEAGR